MKGRKILASALALALMLSMVPAGAAAETGTESTETGVTETAPVTQTAALAEGASFELMTQENTTVTDNPWAIDGEYSFYLYNPSEWHNFDLMSGQLNPVIMVYPDQPYASEEEAYQALVDLGIIDIAEANDAFVIIPNPLNGTTYTEADVNLYYTAQVYLAGGKIVSFTPPEGEYTRKTYNNMLYVIGEGEGATFINNCLTQNANRIASVVTFGGEISADTKDGVALPAYLVNASEDAVNYYKTVNQTDTQDGNVYVNSSYTEKKVIVAEGGDSFDKENIETAWADLLSRTTRAPLANDVVANTFDTSEWVLMTWPSYDEIGLTVTETTYTWGNDANPEREYVCENYVPSSYNSEEAVPLVVLLHGYSEDPLCPAATCGWADKAAEEGFILIAPDYVNDLTASGVVVDCIMTAVNQALETYNIDTSRIYMTGFSMGGMSTMLTGFANADVFAAIAPMSGNADITALQADAEKYDLPVYFSTGNADSKNIVTADDGTKSANAMAEDVYGKLAAFNGIEVTAEPDYSINIFGYEPEDSETRTYQDVEYTINKYYAEGYTNPLMELVEIDGVAHACSDVYADLAWEFMSKFARGEDGSVIELFDDVQDSGKYYYEPVYWATSHEITNGYNDNTFRPNTACTRAQFVTFLWRASGMPEPSSTVSTFTDVQNTESYYYKAVLWAVEKGITQGYSDNTFRPNQTVTRGQAVTFLYRLSGETYEGTASFTDVPASNHFAAAIAWAASCGITNGYSDGSFHPGTAVTRANAVAFLYRYMTK